MLGLAESVSHGGQLGLVAVDQKDAVLPAVR